jgi:hypothetical protein
MTRQIEPLTSQMASEEAYEYGLLGTIESLGVGTIATLGAMNAESKPVIFMCGAVAGLAVAGAGICINKAKQRWQLANELWRAEQAETSL